MADMTAVRAGRGKVVKKPHQDLTDQQKGTLRRVKMYLPSAVNVFEKAYSGRSRTSGVKAKCIECSNLQKSEVGPCTLEGCPLWPYRPYRGRKA